MIRIAYHYINRSALLDLISSLESPTNATRLQEARLEAGESTVRHMQLVFPIVAKIQAEVISRYGFSPDGRGSVAFTEHVKLYARDDEEIARLHAVAKEYFIPSLPHRN